MFTTYSHGVWLDFHTWWAHQVSVLTQLMTIWEKGRKEEWTCVSCVTSLLTHMLYYPTGPQQNASVKMKLCKISRWQSIKPSMATLSSSITCACRLRPSTHEVSPTHLNHRFIQQSPYIWTFKLSTFEDGNFPVSSCCTILLYFSRCCAVSLQVFSFVCVFVVYVLFVWKVL